MAVTAPLEALPRLVTRYTLFFAVVAREVLPSIVLATVCAKCISLVQILHRQPQPVHPPTSTRQDLSHVVRPLCAALFVMVGLARPSLLGATLLVLGVVCHVTWALSADYGCGLFNRLAPHAIYYVGVLLALEYLTHSRSISTFLVENKDATAVAGVLGLQGDQVRSAHVVVGVGERVCRWLGGCQCQCWSGCWVVLVSMVALVLAVLLLMLVGVDDSVDAAVDVDPVACVTLKVGDWVDVVIDSGSHTGGGLGAGSRVGTGRRSKEDKTEAFRESQLC